MNERNVVSLLTNNPSGVLARVTTLFCRHGAAIEGLTLSATGESGVSRITVTTSAGSRALAQLALQVRRLVDISQVSVLEGSSHWRELLEVKLEGPQDETLTALARQYRAELLNAADGSTVLELTGSPSYLDTFLEKLASYTILDMSRTAVAAPELNCMRQCG